MTKAKQSAGITMLVRMGGGIKKGKEDVTEAIKEVAPVTIKAKAGGAAAGTALARREAVRGKGLKRLVVKRRQP